MRAKLQNGGLTEGLLVLLGIIIVIFVLLGKSGVPGTTFAPSLAGPVSENNPSVISNTSVSSGVATPTRTSSFKNEIHLELGNAPYATEPFQEYVSVENDGNTSVDVTGWKLSNAKGSRTYSVGGNQQTFASDVVTIPQGTALISSPSSPAQDIILKPGESVDIITGSAGNSSPYKINSFKENDCTGYLTQQNTYGYTFSPSLHQACVQPRNEPNADGLDLTCQNYIASMSSCHTPKYNTVDSKGNVCSDCVDGNSSLSNACVAYIQTHFSYESCLANHENDPNFYGSIWHVYLNRAFELWAANHEVITLYDSSGKVDDYISY